jgi:uncharacterized protein
MFRKSDTTNPIWFFIQYASILAGMVIFFALMGYVVGAFLIQFIWGIKLTDNASIFQQYATDTTALNAVKLLQVTITIGAMIIPAWFFPKAMGWKHSPSFIYLQKPPRSISLLLAACIIIVSSPFVSALVEWNANLTLPSQWAQLEAKLKASEHAAEQMSHAFIKANTWLEWVTAIGIVALLPAFAEELLFRGAIMRFLQVVTYNMHIGIIVSAILFSAFHGQFYGFVPRFCMGVILGYLCWYAHSLWPAILAHAMNNAFAVYAYNLPQQLPNVLQHDYQFSATTIGLSLLLTIIGLIFYKKILYPYDHAHYVD